MEKEKDNKTSSEMDGKNLFYNINNVSKNILICYKNMAYLSEQGKTDSLEYQECLQMLDSLTKIEDYYYDYFAKNYDKVFNDFMDTFLVTFHILNVKIIASGEWYLLFKEVSDDVLCGYRIHLNVQKILNCLAFDDVHMRNINSDALRYTDAKRVSLFLKLLKEVRDDKDCGSHKKEINNALYDFSFIYKIDNDAKTEDESLSLISSQSLGTLENLCRKISRLSKDSCSLPGNFRSISLNNCYIKSLFITLPYRTSQSMFDKISSDESIDKSKYGYKALESLVDMIGPLKEEYNGEEFTLKRKF